MRNRRPGKCQDCGEHVPVGRGEMYFLRSVNAWFVRCIKCFDARMASRQKSAEQRREG